jgi:dTDP-glucose pyrophosphorylase
MTAFEQNLLSPTTKIKDALAVIDASAGAVVMVVDEGRHLMGIVSDGDIRRALLRGLSLDAPLSQVMNRNPISVAVGAEREEVLHLMQKRVLRHIPVIDGEGRVIALRTLDEFIRPEPKSNWVVIMAGGVGQRLMPLTEKCPKPMLKLGDRPLLEIILERLVAQGFHRFFIAINYLGDLVKAHFQDGSGLGAEISYLQETSALGTAGALRLLPGIPSEPVIVVNGDVLTSLDFRAMLTFHAEHKASGTMGVREYEFQVPYGVVNVSEHSITAIQEKPVKRHLINGGLYVLNPEVLPLVPKEGRFDMTELFDRIHEKGLNAVAFPIREYWIDIGHVDDLARANNEIADFLL